MLNALHHRRAARDFLSGFCLSDKQLHLVFQETTMASSEFKNESGRASRSNNLQALGSRASPSSGPAKANKSALCIIPSREVWEPIQDIRKVHDKSYHRWMPHINLLYPFWEDREDNFDVAAEKLKDALAAVEPFTITFSNFNYFSHGRSCTVWLDPGEALPELQRLQSLALGEFPECNDLNTRSEQGFRPHLSVGQWPNVREAEQAIAAMGANWHPISFQVEGVDLISRSGFHDPFEVRKRVPLGGGLRQCVSEGGDSKEDAMMDKLSSGLAVESETGSSPRKESSEAVECMSAGLGRMAVGGSKSQELQKAGDLGNEEVASELLEKFDSVKL